MNPAFPGCPDRQYLNVRFHRYQTFDQVKYCYFEGQLSARSGQSCVCVSGVFFTTIVTCIAERKPENESCIGYEHTHYKYALRELKDRMAGVMVGIVILVIIALCAIIVYLDASAHGIGDISEHRSSFNKSATYWAIATLFLWPYAFPYYLRIRRKLIEAAVEHPVQENLRVLKASIVTLGAAGFVLVSVAFPS